MSNLAEQLDHPLEVIGEWHAGYEEILTAGALNFVGELVQQFGHKRDLLLSERVTRQKKFDQGNLPDFRPETSSIREGEWVVAPIPAPLQDRRVEITGPAEPKMIINALNSGAKVFMADTEDSLSPTWERIVEAQIALKAAAHGTLEYTSPEGKHYMLHEQVATLIVRPRGWHLPEKHVLYKGKPIPGALFDFGVFFWHNAEHMAEKGTGPFFYLPKLESMEEAELWAEIFRFSENLKGLKHGTIKATVLIEVITSVFQMHEILYALKDYAAGLNCGRWDYIFSYIKKFSRHADKVLPDRVQVTMDKHFLKSYSELLIQTCHKRGAFAMGGMAPQIPIKGDDEKNNAALAKVKADKEREAGLGHDGTWVAHPGLIPVAMEVFNRLMPTPNQLHVKREEVSVTKADLLQPSAGTITEAGLRNNANVAMRYMASWLDGNGCVPIFNLMEDAATAEISRAQLWQWSHHDSGKLEDGRHITVELVKEIIAEESEAIREDIGDDAFQNGRYGEAADLLTDLTMRESFEEFLTLPAYLAME